MASLPPIFMPFGEPQKIESLSAKYDSTPPANHLHGTMYVSTSTVLPNKNIPGCEDSVGTSPASTTLSRFSTPSLEDTSAPFIIRNTFIDCAPGSPQTPREIRSCPPTVCDFSVKPPPGLEFERSPGMSSGYYSASALSPWSPDMVAVLVAEAAAFGTPNQTSAESPLSLPRFPSHESFSPSCCRSPHRDFTAVAPAATTERYVTNANTNAEKRTPTLSDAKQTLGRQGSCMSACQSSDVVAMAVAMAADTAEVHSPSFSSFERPQNFKAPVHSPIRGGASVNMGLRSPGKLDPMALAHSFASIVADGIGPLGGGITSSSEKALTDQWWRPLEDISECDEEHVAHSNIASSGHLGAIQSMPNSICGSNSHGLTDVNVILEAAAQGPRLFLDAESNLNENENMGHLPPKESKVVATTCTHLTCMPLNAVGSPNGGEGFCSPASPQNLHNPFSNSWRNSAQDTYGLFARSWADTSCFDGDLSTSCKASISLVAELVEHECGFLRLRGYKLHPEMSKRAKQRNVVATLRFYVEGLPRQKRAKWLLPLRWCVAPVLQRRNCAAAVQGGELYAPLEGGAYVRFDFAAARE